LVSKVILKVKINFVFLGFGVHMAIPKVYLFHSSDYLGFPVKEVKSIFSYQCSIYEPSEGNPNQCWGFSQDARYLSNLTAIYEMR
jgi:hypothetical protein